MLLALLPLVTTAAGAAAPPAEVALSRAADRAAQVQLAEVLSGAEAIEAVEARGSVIAFSIIRDHRLVRVVAMTAQRGEVTGLTVESAGLAGHAAAERQALSWLAGELADATAITRLTPIDHGGVLLSTSDDRRYLIALGGRGSLDQIRTGNEAAAARWGAAWSAN